MKIKLTLVLIIVALFSCTKENGKKEYILFFQFDSGELVEITSYVFEKEMKGSKPVFIDSRRRSVVNQIYIRSQVYQLPENEMSLSIYKTDASFLIGSNYIKIPISNASFASGLDIDLNGTIEMNGKYVRKGRKFIVENGTFTINWTNAADYGQPVQELTGTWSLRRK